MAGVPALGDQSASCMIVCCAAAVVDDEIGPVDRKYFHAYAFNVTELARVLAIANFTYILGVLY
jgi:hypothetical protein